MWLFRTKKTNLAFLNVSFAAWTIGIIVFGVVDRGRDMLTVLLMLLFGGVLYGVNRLGLSLAYHKRPTATAEDIEAARRMLYGDKE